MIKKLLVANPFFALFILFAVSSSNAYDPQWKENQQAMFQEINLKPGDVIGKDNWKKIKGLVPADMEKWVKSGKVIINIGSFKYDASSDDEWDQYGLKHNKGKYTLHDNGNVIETATDDFPKWVYGYPFPDIDLKKDPDAGIKLSHNRDINRGRDGIFKGPFTVEWIGEKGFERVISNNYYRYNFWGTKQTKNDGNASGMLFMEATVVIEPYDVAGTAQLTYRKTDGSEDQLYVYIPAIRRTKRMSGANRSDPFMGSDFTIDDGNGWLGHTSAMEWRYVEERTGLMCIAKFCTESYTMMGQTSDGRWKAVTDVPGIKTGWQVKGHTQAAWSPVTSVWVPRKFHVIEAKPKDPYYNMGKMEFWLDKKTLWSQYKLMWDIAGEYWKTGSFMCQFMKWGDNITQSSNMHLFYDNKTDHATVLRSSGKNIFGRDLLYEINIPDNKDQYTVGRLGTWTK